MNTMEPVKIYPGTNLHKELPDATVKAFFVWLRSNGVDPNGVPMDQLMTIDQVIDFWWYTKPGTPDPQGTSELDRIWAADEFPLSHHQMRVTQPLPEDLADALRKVASRRAWTPLTSAEWRLRSSTGRSR